MERIALVFFVILGYLSAAGSLPEVKTDGEIKISSKTNAFPDNVSYLRSSLFECTPSIKAVYMIISSKKLKLIPLERLQSDTEYRCLPNPKYISAPAEEISPLVFRTEPFRLESVEYYKNEKILDISFNDRVDPESLKKNMEIYKRDKLSKTALQYRIDKIDGNRVLARITEPTGKDIRLFLHAGLKSLSQRVLSKDTEQKAEGERKKKKDVKLSSEKPPMDFVDKPRMVAREDGGFAIRLFFEDPFEYEPVKEYIEIDGIDDFKLKKDVYMSDSYREENNISSSYYYIDIISDQFLPNTSYTLRLKKGLKNYDELKEDKVFRLKTGDRKKGIFFGNWALYVSSIGEIGFSSVNIDHATLTVERVVDDNYRYYINYNESNIENTAKFSEPIFTKELTLNNPKNKICKQKFKISDIAGGVPWGIYRIILDYEDRDRFGHKKNLSASKVIFVSDIGISADLSRDQIFTALYRFSDAEAVKGAKVEIYSSRNTLIASATADDRGIAVIDKKEIIAEDPKVIVVSKGDDRNFLLLNNSLNGVDRNGITGKKERYRANIYFQSDIIRPGNILHAMIMIKDRDIVSADGIPVAVTLKRADDTVVSKKILKCDSSGVIDFSYNLDRNAPTGPYTLYVKLGRKVIGQKRIDVESFMPPAIENEIKTDKEFYMGSDYAEITVLSRYMFGAPASGLQGKLSFSASAYDYNSSSYVGYTFSNSEIEDENDRIYLSWEEDIKLNDKGEAKVLFPCSPFQKVPSVLKALIGATIMDDAQPVSTYSDVIIYPYRKMVGLKLDNESIKSGGKVSGDIVLIDPVTGRKEKGILSVIIKKIDWHYSYSNGNYEWKKEKRTVDTFAVNANRHFERTINDNGDYIIEVVDRFGGHSASRDFEVSGWSYVNISPAEDLKSVEIDFDDKLYRRGDVLKVSIKSPVTAGTVLVTLEGEKIHWHKRFHIDKGVAEIDVPLEVDMGYGKYLHATVIRKTDRGSSIIPFRASGYKFIKADRTAHRINVDIDCKAVAPSNSKVRLEIRTDREAELLVSVVDSAILGMTGQKIPEPFRFFTPAPDRKIVYYDLYDKVMAYIAEGKLISFGAGDAELEEMRKKHLAPDNIDRIKPFMLWSGVIKTSNKKAVYDLKIPQFNGRASIVVIAVNKDAIGAAGRDIVIRDDIMLKPSLPRFLLLGDKMNIALRVFNTTQKEKFVRLYCSSSSNLSLGIKERSIKIPAKGSTLLYIPLSATKEGKGWIEFRAETQNKKFVNRTELGVNSLYAVQSIGYRGSVSRKTILPVPDAYIGGKIMVSISDNIIGSMQKDLKYLIGYPYGCAEQTASKIAAMFYSAPYMKDEKNSAKSKTFIRQGIRKLTRLQNIHGEFAYWREGDYVDPYASIYASQVLLDLDRAGFHIGDEVKSSIVGALKNIALGKSVGFTGKYDEHHRIYSAFVLSENGLLDDEILNLLYDSGKYKNYYISRFYMAAMLKKAGREMESRKIYASVSGIDLEDIGKVDYDIPNAREFASRGRDGFLLIYLEAKYFEKREKDFQTAVKWLEELYSTHEKALAFRALSAWLGKGVGRPMRVKMVINGEEKVFDKSTVFTVDAKSTPVVIEPLSGVVNYSVECYKALPLPPKNRIDPSKVISIEREFVDIKGNILDPEALEQGSRIYARIDISNMKKLKNIVLDHRVPACMEIVNRRTSGESSKMSNVNFNPSYTDVRDDRILYFFDLNQKTKLVKTANGKRTKRVAVQNTSTLFIPLTVAGLGECSIPPVTVELMYDIRIHDYALEGGKLKVFRKGEVPAGKKINRADDKSRIKKMIEEFYRLEASSTDPKAFGRFFSYPVKKYFRYHNLSKEDIVSDKSRYFKAWPVRRYRISKLEVTRLSRSEYSVKVLFSYHLANGNRKTSGRSSQYIHLIKRGSDFLIDEIYIDNAR